MCKVIIYWMERDPVAGRAHWVGYCEKLNQHLNELGKLEFGCKEDTQKCNIRSSMLGGILLQGGRSGLRIEQCQPANQGEFVI